MAMEAHASEKGQTTIHGSAVPRAPDIRDEEEGVLELESPWVVVERAPTLLSLSSDEKLKVLVDRFQRPDGFDLWSDKDGPQLFDKVDLKNSMDEQGNS